MRFWLIAALTAVALPALTAPALAQEEIIVTASKRSAQVQLPVVTLKRTADFLVQPVQIVGDTRDADKRKAEIWAMLAGAIDLAAKRGAVIQLATGNGFVKAITKANYKDLPLEEDDDRDDTNLVAFLVKTPLSGARDTDAARERIKAFIKTVPVVGRAELKADGDNSLSVVNPGQYRRAIIDLVAADARDAAARLGDGYAVTINGLDEQVQWGPAADGEVALFLPYDYTVVPKSH
jgi:hypothetical protein